MTQQQLIADTAKAWHLSYNKVHDLYMWVGRNVQDPKLRGLRFAELLRREYNKGLPQRAQGNKPARQTRAFWR